MVNIKSEDYDSEPAVCFSLSSFHIRPDEKIIKCLIRTFQYMLSSLKSCTALPWRVHWHHPEDLRGQWGEHDWCSRRNNKSSSNVSCSWSALLCSQPLAAPALTFLFQRSTDFKHTNGTTTCWLTFTGVFILMFLSSTTPTALLAQEQNIPVQIQVLHSYFYWSNKVIVN